MSLFDEELDDIEAVLADREHVDTVAFGAIGEDGSEATLVSRRLPERQQLVSALAVQLLGLADVMDVHPAIIGHDVVQTAYRIQHEEARVTTTDSELRADGGIKNSDREHEGSFDEYRTAPLRFPLHILDQYGDALCGNLGEDQQRFLDRHGYLYQPTVEEKRDGQPWEYFHGDLCGTCRAVLLSRVDDEEMHRGWEKRQEAIANV